MVIGDGAGSPYTSFGSEPFTPNNQLTTSTFQLQDSVTKVTTATTPLTFGGAVEKYHSDNSFYFGIQSAYAYNSLADFYADANGYLANPNRTVSPVTLSIFQVKYLLQPGQTTPPLQPLDVWYTSGYVQDEWRLRTNLTVTAGLRVDVPKFSDTAFPNAAADALTFRDQDGSASQVLERRAAGDDAVLVAPRRLQLGCAVGRHDAGARRHRPLHRQAAVRLDLEPDRQHRRADRIRRQQDHDRVPVQPESGQVQAGADRGVGRAATSSTSPIPASGSRRRGAPTSPSTGSCRWGSSARRLHLQQGPQRACLHQRQPAGGAVGVHRCRQPPALGRDDRISGVRGGRTGRPLRDAVEQRPGQSGDGRRT